MTDEPILQQSGVSERRSRHHGGYPLLAAAVIRSAWIDGDKEFFASPWCELLSSVSGDESAARMGKKTVPTLVRVEDIARDEEMSRADVVAGIRRARIPHVTRGGCGTASDYYVCLADVPRVVAAARYLLLRDEARKDAREYGRQKKK